MQVRQLTQDMQTLGRECCRQISNLSSGYSHKTIASKLTALMTPNSSRGPGYFPNHQVDHAKLFIAATAMPACIIGLSLTQPSPAFLFPESSLPLRNERF